MFNNRDLIIMGAGAALAIFCLFIPIPFILKAIVGGLLLLASMVIALLRLGPDHVPLETWALRRWRFHGKARRYTYHQPSQAVDVEDMPTPDPPDEPEPASKPASQPQAQAPLIASASASMDWSEVGVYNLVRIWLFVIGAYFVYWIFQGGAEELGAMFEFLLK